MNPAEINTAIAGLQAKLDKELENYNMAIDENKGFDTRKKIREEMRRIGAEIIDLKKMIPPTNIE